MKRPLRAALRKLEIDLTEQETSVLFLILLDKKDNEIADESGLSVSTVRRTWSSVREKLGVKRRQAVAQRLFAPHLPDEAKEWSAAHPPPPPLTVPTRRVAR